jgi:hypothetical protein
MNLSSPSKIRKTRVTTNEVIGLLNWWCRTCARTVNRLGRLCAMAKGIHVRFGRFLLATQSNDQVNKCDIWYPNMMLWWFKFSVLGIRERDVVMWVRDSTWIMLCTNVYLRYTYKLRRNRKSLLLKFKNFITKGNTTLELCMMRFTPTCAKLVKW